MYSRISQISLFMLVSTFVLAAPRQAMNHDVPAVSQTAMRHQVRLPIEDFSLIDQASGSFKFQALRGKVVLVTFMYTTCPDVCPLLTANMRVLQERLTATERKATFLLSITTDPEVDTPNVLKSYAERYKVDFSNWSFLSGDQKSLERVWKMFGVKVERKARGLVNHTTLTGVVDQKGIMRLAYSDAAPDPKKILHDVRSLLGPP